MARPPTPPLKREGKFAYTRFGERLVCFPWEVIQKDEEELIKAINFAYDKSNMQVLTEEQHRRLMRLLHGHAISFDTNWR